MYFTDQDNTEVDVENSILVSKLPRVKNKTIWPLGTNSMHRLTPAELEKQLKKMKNTQVISICMDMASQLRLLEKQSSTKLEKINEEDELSISEDLFDSISSLGRTRCRFSVSGCPFRLPSMEEHELRECKFRPARCPSLTCPVRPPFAKLLRHIDVSFILNCTEKPFSPKRNFLGFLSKQKKFQKKNQVSKLRKDIRVTQIFQTILYAEHLIKTK